MLAWYVYHGICMRFVKPAVVRNSLLLLLYRFHIDYIINGIIVPEVQCQQDSSNFKNFPEDPSRMNDSGFLQLQYPGFNSDVFHSLPNLFWCCFQSPDDHWNDRHFHIP